MLYNIACKPAQIDRNPARLNMFELADRLVGIYKTKDVTKSVTINPKAIETIRKSLKDLEILDRVPDANELFLPGFAPVKL